MGPTPVELIRVGESPARILGVARARLEYIDMSGQLQSIDLDQCARNLTRRYNHHIKEPILLTFPIDADINVCNSRCVGNRGAVSNPPWVELMNERNTRFEFKSYQAIYRELLSPLGQAGWHTFDMD